MEWRTDNWNYLAEKQFGLEAVDSRRGQLWTVDEASSGYIRVSWVECGALDQERTVESYSTLLSLPGKARLILLSLRGRETASVVCQAETGKLSIDSTFRRQSDRLGTVRRK